VRRWVAIPFGLVTLAIVGALIIGGEPMDARIFGPERALLTWPSTLLVLLLFGVLIRTWLRLGTRNEDQAELGRSERR
jgi:hypothetical protein